MAFSSAEVWSQLKSRSGELPPAVYSVSSDPRAGAWQSDISSINTDQRLISFLPVKIPLLEVVFGIDLSSADDLSAVDLLLYKPLPMSLHLVPVYVAGSVANEILTRCYQTIYGSEADRERLRDFLRALDQFTWMRKDPSDWTRVSEKQAKFACQVFTKNLNEANRIIDGGLESEVPAVALNLSPRTAIVNGIRIVNATIETLLPLMVSAQLTYRDEL